MTTTTDSGSPPSPPSPPKRRPRSQQRQRSWSPQSLSPSGGRRSRSRSWSPVAGSLLSSSDAAAQEEAKALYMFFWYPGSKIAYCLFGINLPNPVLPLPPLQPCNQFRESDKTIYPILQLRSGEYPEVMCCVELESKLYLFGGRLCSPSRGRFYVEFPPDVYVLDTATISPNTNTTSKLPSELLKKGTAMNSGKVDPYAFVVDKRIYVIGTDSPFKKVRFEVFNLEHNKWSILPEPRISRSFSGHAVIGRMVFVATLSEGVYSYNIDTGVWVQFRGCSWMHPFEKSAELIEDTLYAIYFNTFAAFGPIDDSKTEAEAKGLFNRLTLLSSPDVEAIVNCIQRRGDQSYLVHLRNRVFCYVLTRRIPDPKFPDAAFSEHPEDRDVRIMTLEVVRENNTESSIEGDRTFYQAKLLHAAQFVARNKGGMGAGHALLLCCFTIPKSNVKSTRLHGEP